MARIILLLAATGLALAGCKEAKPAANRIDAANNGLAEGVATTEGEKALRDTIRIGKRSTVASAKSETAAAGETCIERYGASLPASAAWAGKLPPGFALPRGTRVTEAAGRDGADCAIRIVSATSPGSDRESVAAAWERAAKTAGYDAGRTTRGADLVVAGTHDDAAYMAMIGAPKGGVIPVDWVWSRGG